MHSLGCSWGRGPRTQQAIPRLDHWPGICLGSHVGESLPQGVDSSPARGMHSRGQMPALVLGTVPGAKHRWGAGSASQGAGWWRCRACPHVRSPHLRCGQTHQLDSPASRRLGRARLTRSVRVAAGAALGTTKCGTGILGVAATRNPRDLGLPSSVQGRFRKQTCGWFVLGVEEWQVRVAGGRGDVTRQSGSKHSNRCVQLPFRTRRKSPAQTQQPCRLLLEVRRGRQASQAIVVLSWLVA